MLSYTVLPNGVKVAVWDLNKMFQKWKKWFYHVVCIPIERIWSNNEQVTTQNFKFGLNSAGVPR